jgi:hypothetical protein
LSPPNCPEFIFEQGQPWSTDDRLKWMKMLVLAFDLAYGESDGVMEITKEGGAAKQ